MNAATDADRAKAFGLLTASPPRTDINPYWRVDMVAAALAEARATERAEADQLRDAMRALAEDRAEVHYVGMQAVREMPSDWYCPRSEPGRSRRDCPECVAEVALDAALAVAYGDAARVRDLADGGRR